MRFNSNICLSVLCGLGVLGSFAHAQTTAKPGLTEQVKETNQVLDQAKASNGSIPLDQAKPQPLTPNHEPAKGAKGGTEAVITAKGASFFDTKQSVGVFTDDVVVVHPQFHLTCQELQVFMLKDNEKPIKGDTKNAADRAIMRRKTPLPGEEPEPEPDNSIREAIAKGPKVVIQKLSEDGQVQVGICRHATYIGATGDIIMRDYPQLQRENDMIIATDPSTIITIKQSGKIITQGPNRVQLLQGNGKKKETEVAPHQAPPANSHLPQPKFGIPKPNSGN